MVRERRDLSLRAAAQLTRCTPEAEWLHRRRHGAASVPATQPRGNADKLWDSTLRQIDVVLDDDVLVDRVAEALAQRHAQRRRRGRLGTPAAVVLRMLVLKHLHDWTFDECEREVRGSLVYRAFCRIDGERVPDAKT